MKLTWPNALPLTSTWSGVTSTASAISGLETEKRPTGRSKLITRDCPTRTLTAIDSLFWAKDALYEFSCACAMEVPKIVIRDASNKLTRREIGERLCMILCSFVSSDRQCDQLQLSPLVLSDLWKLDAALLSAFDHFH